MVGLWILALLLGLLVLLALLPVELSGRLHLEGLRGQLQYQIRVGPVSLKGTRALLEAADEAPKLAQKVQRKLPDFLPQSPRAILAWARPAIDYFRRRIRFRRLDLAVAVGGLDAFESAMLAGVIWTAAGLIGSLLSHVVQLPPRLYRVTVKPNWQEPELGLNVDCMLTFRVGHAIWAGVLLVPQALKSVRAARRRRERQKGEEARG